MSKSSVLEKIGWLGTQLLAWCAAPAAYQVYMQGHAQGYDGAFIAMWGLGELLCFFYVLFRYKDKPLLVNYTLNLVFIGIIAYYMI